MTEKRPSSARLAAVAELRASPDPLSRIRGLELCGALGPFGLEGILAAFADRDPPVRRAAIELAGRLAPADRLLAIVRSDDASSRVAACAALATQGARALPALNEALDSADDDLAMFA